MTRPPLPADVQLACTIAGIGMYIVVGVSLAFFIVSVAYSLYKAFIRWWQ